MNALKTFAFSTFTVATLALFTSLASAKVVDVSGSDTVKIQSLPNKDVVIETTGKTSTLPQKPPTKKAAVLKKQKLAEPKTASLPKLLPAFKGHVIAAPRPAQAVIVREAIVDTPVSNNVQVIKPREVKEASYFEVINENDEPSSQHQLGQALPDSDSFVPTPERAAISRTYIEAKPAALKIEAAVAVTAPVQPVQPVQTSAPMPAPIVEPSIQTPLQAVVAAEPVATVAGLQATPPAEPAPVSIMTETPRAPLPTLPSYWPYSAHDASANLTNSAMADSVSGMSTSLSTSLDDQILDTDRDLSRPQSEAGLDREKAADQTAYTESSNPIMKTTFLIPSGERPRRRVFVRTGYLNAEYNQLEGDLKNGATVFGVSISQLFTTTEVRLGLDVAHGLDQELSLRNTRMAMFRAEGLYQFKSLGIFHAFGGGAIGVAEVDVNSYHRSAASNDVELRENAKGTVLLGAPEVGIRGLISRDLSLDITAQYLLLAGGAPISKLGGWLGELALGFSF